MTYKQKWRQVDAAEFERITKENITSPEWLTVRLQFEEQVFIGQLIARTSNGIFVTHTIATRFGDITFGGDSPDANPKQYFVERDDYVELPQALGASVWKHTGTHYVRVRPNGWVAVLPVSNDNFPTTHVKLYTDKDMRDYGFKLAP